MQLQKARQQKEETQQKFLDRCRSLAMNRVSEVHDPLQTKKKKQTPWP